MAVAQPAWSPLGIWGVSLHAEACRRLLLLTWGAEGAHTPPLLFFSSPFLAHSQGGGEEVPEGSLPALPGGLHREVLLAALCRLCQPIVFLQERFVFAVLPQHFLVRGGQWVEVPLSV